MIHLLRCYSCLVGCHEVPSISIVLTGYCISAVAESCPISAFQASVTGAMQDIAAADPAVTFWDMAEVCGGTINPESQGNSKYFVSDGIHLNDQGYARLWSNSALQTAFGCSTSSSPSPSVSPSPSPKPVSKACTWSALGIAFLNQNSLLQSAGSPVEGGIVEESVFKLPELAEAGGKDAAAEGGYITCPNGDGDSTGTPTPSPSHSPPPQQPISGACHWTALGIASLTTDNGLMQKVGNPKEGDIVDESVFSLPEFEDGGKDGVVESGYIGCPEGGGDFSVAPMPSPPPSPPPQKRSTVCEWTALGIATLTQYDLFQKTENPEEGDEVDESVFELPELQAVGGTIGAVEKGYISCSEGEGDEDDEETEGKACRDDDVELSRWSEEQTACMEWAWECDNSEVKKFCPLTCCKETCVDDYSSGRRLCASGAAEVMLFDSALPMDWSSLAPGDMAAIRSVKDGAVLTAASTDALKAFGTNMVKQVTSNTASKLNIPESELNGVCIYLLGDPKRISLADTTTVCDSQGYSEASSTTMANISAQIDGLGLQGIVTRNFMRLVLNNGTEPASETNKRNSQLMTEFLIKLNFDFKFVFAGVESISKCLPFKFSSLGRRSSNGGATTANTESNTSVPTPTPTFVAAPAPMPAQAPTPLANVTEGDSTTADGAMSTAMLGMAIFLLGATHMFV